MQALEQMAGLNGAAFTDGFAVMVWEVVAVPVARDTKPMKAA